MKRMRMMWLALALAVAWTCEAQTEMECSLSGMVIEEYEEILTDLGDLLATISEEQWPPMWEGLSEKYTREWRAAVEMASKHDPLTPWGKASWKLAAVFVVMKSPQGVTKTRYVEKYGAVWAEYLELYAAACPEEE